MRNSSPSRRLVPDRAAAVVVEQPDRAAPALRRDVLELASSLHRVGIAPCLDGLADALDRWASPVRTAARRW